MLSSGFCRLICRCLAPGQLLHHGKAVQPPIPPRVLLIGPSGSGKTSFLYRLKTGENFDVSPTTGCNVEEIPVAPKISLIFSDIGGSDRRDMRLHFLHSIPILDLSLLFFLDASSPPESISASLEDLVYAIAYAHSRTGGLRYIGVVLNQQDKLAGSEEQYDIVKRIKAETEELLEAAIATVNLAEGTEMSYETEEGGLIDGEKRKGERVQWKVFDGGDKGVSVKTGQGIKEVFEGLCKAVFGIKPVRVKAVTGSPVGY